MGNPWITTDHYSNISNICRGLIESHGIPGNEVAPGAHLAVGTALLHDMHDMHDMHDNLLTTCSQPALDLSVSAFLIVFSGRSYTS